MNLIKFRKPSHDYGLSGFFDDFFRNEILDPSKRHSMMARRPFTNIIDNENDYVIELAIPGIKKDDVDIRVDGDQLIVSSEKEESHEEEDKQTNFTKREFNYSSFQQSYHLPDSIDSENITAKYEDGILKLSLKKKESELKKAPKRISIK